MLENYRNNLNEREIRLNIILLYEEGLSQRKIAERFTLENTYSTGRKRKQNEETKILIENITKDNRKMSCKKLKSFLSNNHDINLSTTTIYNIRKELKFNFLLPKKRTLLTNKQKEKRLKFAKKYLNNPIDWKKVIFTDEKWFYFSGLKRKIWRQTGERDDSVFERFTKFIPKVMFFGGINYSYQSTLIKCPKIVNSESYQKNIISRSKIFSGMDNLFGKKQWILMQDGATSHTSISTKEYLKKKCNVLKKWPPNSPDLNPIEHLWGIMDKKISDETPKTKNQLIKKM
ncbi:transposable element-related [Anaeramoeba flamelloides]|uniref:Transposable element-related n=1 Tax=Anaeramoeba flamelloides TaxID=1746091 RepID=A0AAV7YEF8_9EUKA|nr:transposable element-related [Anaeramoeba flamelloides]